jgi:hypothetical protein
MRLILIFFFSIFVSTVEARMYQWVEPGIETTQLSGKPPAWYRSASGGPRVFVFENGRLIDDTAVKVSDEVRQRMRQEAFVLAEEDRKKALEKIAKTEALEKKLKNKQVLENKDSQKEQGQEENSSSVERITDSLFPEEEVKEERKAEKSLEELKAIISDWEASQTENAKKALE